jgi:hypothetical protein
MNAPTKGCTERKIDTLTMKELQRLLANAKNPEQQDELAEGLLTHDAKSYSPEKKSG